MPPLRRSHLAVPLAPNALVALLLDAYSCDFIIDIALLTLHVFILGYLILKSGILSEGSRAPLPARGGRLHGRQLRPASYLRLRQDSRHSHAAHCRRHDHLPALAPGKKEKTARRGKNMPSNPANAR